MKEMKSLLPKAVLIFVIFSAVCGILYTGVVTAVAQIIFPDKANGSIIEENGKKYGSELLGQQYTDDAHMWGRIMNVDVTTYTDKDGNALIYASPSNLSPASEEYQAARIAKANDMTEDEVRDIVKKCTDGRFLGIFGEETVNVLEVNLMLDGIL